MEQILGSPVRTGRGVEQVDDRDGKVEGTVRYEVEMHEWVVLPLGPERMDSRS